MLRQRQPRETDDAFLAFVRLQPCIACGAPPKSQAAHIRAACPERGKRETGHSEKSSDRWCVPLCAGCHLDGPEALHRVAERPFFARLGIDPFAVAAELYAKFSAVPRRRRAVNGVKTHKTKSRASPQRKRPWPIRPFPKGRGFERGKSR
jgi:hypothetical protein